MVDDGCHREDAAQDADDVDEQRVPLVMRLDLQHGHRVGFIPT